MKGYVAATFISLRQRNYRLFFLGQSVSQTGTWMQKMAQAWLILQLTDSGTWLGLTLAIQQLPVPILSPWAGLLADRHAKRTILLWSAGAGAVPAVLLGVLSVSHQLNIEVVLGLALFTGVVESIMKPALQAFPSELVTSVQLGNAVTLTNLMNDVGKSVGPALAGVLIGSVGISFAFFINAASFAAVAAGLLLMRPTEFTSQDRLARTRGQVRAGLREVRSTPLLLWPLLLLATAGLLAYNFQVLLLLLGRDTFGGDAKIAGYLLGAFGLGAVVGGIALAGLLRPTLLRIIGAATLFALLLLSVAFAPNLLAALILVALLGAASVAFKTLTSTWLQLTAAPTLRGRVVSLVIVSLAGTSPLGAPLVGWIAGSFGPRVAFLVAGTATMLAAGVTLFALRGHVGGRPRRRRLPPTSTAVGETSRARR